MEETCPVEEVENKDQDLDRVILGKERLMLLKKLKKKQQLLLNHKNQSNPKVAEAINSTNQGFELDSTTGKNQQLKDQLMKIY